MARIFFLRKHGCPECGGFANWLAKQCPFCGHDVSFADRCEWSDNWAMAILLLITAGCGSLIVWLISWMPPSIAAMAIAVAISLWYLANTSWENAKSSSVF